MALEKEMFQSPGEVVIVSSDDDMPLIIVPDIPEAFRACRRWSTRQTACHSWTIPTPRHVVNNDDIA